MLSRLLKSLLFLACLFSFTSSFSQAGGPLAGYAYLGSCTVGGQPHYYYLSNDAKMWPAAKIAANDVGGYLATLTSQAENDCVYGKLVTYLTRPGGPGLVPLTKPEGCVDNPVTDPLNKVCSPWNDDRHPWIGLTDAAVEGTFVWDNGENCNNFRNWDAGEPNNYNGGIPASGEDYAQLLAYVPHDPTTSNQQGGKWNDWFNTESQTYIVEFGPTTCATGCTPSTTVTEGDLAPGGITAFSVTSGPGTVTVDHVNAGTGLQSLTVVGVPTNAVVTIPAFTPGTFDPVTVTFTAINPALPVDFTLRAASSYHSIFIRVSCATTVMRGNHGCSHGYWKNAQDKSWTDAGYNRNTQTFVAVFGITNNRGVVTNSTTLQQSLELNGGGYAQVAKQGTAALLNASRGFYPYTPTEIKNAVQSMFNTGSATLPSVTVNGTTYTGGTWSTPQGLAEYLDMLNNLGCPLNNAGLMSISSRATPLNEGGIGMNIRALSNPANGFFNVQVGTSSTEKLSLKVTDMQGKLIENRQNISANQSLIFGNSYRPGIYFVEIIQGAERKQMKLVKAN